MSSLPPLGQSVPIDQAFLNAMTQGLQSAQQSAAASAAVPTVATPASVSPAYTPGTAPQGLGQLGAFQIDPFASEFGEIIPTIHRTKSMKIVIL